MTRDRLLGIVSVLFAVLIAGLTFFTVDPKIRIAGDPGSQIFPYGAALIFALAGSRLIMRKAAKKDPIFLTAGQWKRLFILFFAFAGLCLFDLAHRISDSYHDYAVWNLHHVRQQKRGSSDPENSLCRGYDAGGLWDFPVWFEGNASVRHYRNGLMGGAYELHV